MKHISVLNVQLPCKFLVRVASIYSNKEKIEKKIVIRVSNFAGIASFIRGSELLAIVPEMLIKASLADFSQTEFPFDAPELKVYSLWHQRYQNDAMHQWLRAELFKDS